VIQGHNHTKMENVKIVFVVKKIKSLR